MRVAVYHANDDLRLAERPRPVPQRGEILVRVRASGICGSDLMEWYRRPRAPLVLGHEVAGEVAETGPGVRGVRRGDRVVTTHHLPCGRCRLCLTGRESCCPELGVSHFDPGGFAEFVRVGREAVLRGTFRLPRGVSFAEGSFVEPLACVLRAQRLAGLAPRDGVAILGGGISGLLHLLAARAAGAGPILVIEPAEPRRAAALRFGADAALPAGTEAVAAARRAAGNRLDHVIVCTGARAAFEQAIDLAGPGGTISLFAPLSPSEVLPLPVADLWKRGVRIVPSYAGPPEEMRAALELIASRRVDVAPLVTHRLPLERIADGFRLAAEGGAALKVVIEP